MTTPNYLADWHPISVTASDGMDSDSLDSLESTLQGLCSADFDRAMHVVLAEIKRRIGPDRHELFNMFFTFVVRPELGELRPADRLAIIHKCFVDPTLGLVTHQVYDVANCWKSKHADSGAKVITKSEGPSISVRCGDVQNDQSNSSIRGDPRKSASIVSVGKLDFESATVPSSLSSNSEDLLVDFSPDKKRRSQVESEGRTENAQDETVECRLNVPDISSQIRRSHEAAIIKRKPLPSVSAQSSVCLLDASISPGSDNPKRSSRISLSPSLFTQLSAPADRKLRISIPLPHSKTLSRLRKRADRAFEEWKCELYGIEKGAQCAIPFQRTKQGSLRRALSETRYQIGKLSRELLLQGKDVTKKLWE